MSKVVCFILARKGSKRLPGKNTKLLGKYPLISWTLRAACNSPFLSQIVVSTDDPLVKAIATDFKVTIIDRPEFLAQDDTSSSDAILHALHSLPDKGKQFSYIMLLQCTSPFRTTAQINDTIDKFLKSDIKADSIISVTEFNKPLNWLRKINTHGFLQKICFRELESKLKRKDKVFLPNGAIYLIKKDVFLKKKKFNTQKTIPYIMDHFTSLDIDTEFDFSLAEMYLYKKKDDVIFIETYGSVT